MVRSFAIYDATVAGGEPGDGRRIALVWLARGEEVAPLMVGRDIYGGDENFDVELLHDLEPADPSAFSGLTDRLVAGADVTLTTPDGRELVGEPEPIRLVRSGGPHAAGVPADGWVADLFRTDSDDVMRFWLVLCDDRQVPRAAYAARTRGGGW